MRAPASWNSIAFSTCSSADHSIDGAKDFGLRVADDAAEADSGRWDEVDSDVVEDGPLSYDGPPGSSEGLLRSNDGRPGSKEGRV